MTEQQLALKATQLREGGLLDLLLEKITKDIALEMVQEADEVKRTELYYLANAIKRLDEKLQEYTNNHESQEINNGY